MKRKALIIGLVAALACALVALPADAKKKKKGPKPWKSEEVTIHLGHAAFHGASGTVVAVTAQEFLARCAIPTSNGVDAWVFEVPEEYKKINALVKAIGSAGTPTWDLDLYFYDDACAPTGASNAVGTDETAAMTAGTSYIVLHNYFLHDGGGQQVTAHIELAPATF